jgi:hypothetical protein
MRIPVLLVVVPSALAALAAQQPDLRPSLPLPPRAAAAAPLDPATAARAAATARMQEVAATRAPTVHFDRPRADGPLWAAGANWKASFDARGFEFVPFFGSAAPRNFPLRLELASATVAGRALALADGEPTAVAGTVRTPRGALTELVATRPDHVEQSFEFATLPARGELAVEVRITGEFAASPIEHGLRFANEHGHVDYTKAIAVDAAGRRQELAIEWHGERARMVIPAAFVAEAQLPLVLDPTLTGWFGLASGQSALQHDMDVASFQSSGGRTLVIYQRQWSLTDQDCWGILFDGNLGLVATDFAIDFTANDWLKVAVAGHNYSQNFLVVAEVRIGLVWFIAGRTVAVDGALGAVFDIERDGVVGTGGNNFHPDVGSDPYFGVGRYCVVFNKQTLGASDIYMRQVTPAGGLVTTNAIAIDTSPDNESRPSISKSCGQSNGLPANWLLTWQRTWPTPPFDQEVHGRHVAWNGALPGAVFPIATTVSEESAPSPSSPIDLEGVRYWPVAFEVASTLGQQRDIVCRLFRADGGQQNGFTVSNNVPGADDRDPEADSDGTRFVVTFTTPDLSGTTVGPEAVTAAYLPASDTFRVDERTGLNTSGAADEDQTNVCADYSGGSAMSPRYVVTFREPGNNTFRMWAYGGYVAGTPFTRVANQCGSLSITESGSPVIGQSVQFDVGAAPLSGTILGFPGFIPLNVLGCNCWQGVDNGLYLGNPLVWNVPNNPIYVGITLSVQGWTIGGSQCLGFVDLSDTIDFTLR